MRQGFAIGVLGLALALGACSASETFDKLPEPLGGLPADAPQRPIAPYEYPAVHDMPQARPVKPLSDADLLKLQKELNAAREKQGKAAAAAQEPVAPNLAGSAGNAAKP